MNILKLIAWGIHWFVIIGKLADRMATKAIMKLEQREALRKRK